MDEHVRSTINARFIQELQKLHMSATDTLSAQRQYVNGVKKVPLYGALIYTGVAFMSAPILHAEDDATVMLWVRDEFASLVRYLQMACLLA